MDEKEIMQWDLVPPDMASNDLFFTEESYKKFSIKTDLTKQILSKYMELGPYTYTNDNELPEVKFDMNTASQPSPDSISEVNGLKKNSECCITSNVDDEIENGNNPLPKAMEPVKILDDENSSNSVFENPSSCDNSVKFGSPTTSGELSQNMSYGRKRLHYPRYSLLTNSEQNFYVSKLILYKKSRPEPGCPEYARFLKLHKKVQKEQNEFTGYLQKASVEFKEDYAFLQDVAVQYMQKKQEGILKRLQEHSPFYHPIDKVPIITNYCQTNQLQSVKILLQMGEVPVNFPFLNKKMKTVLDYEILQQRFPTDKTQLPNMESFNCHQVCSKDSNAQRLAQKYQCDIVLSSSVFKCLVDNHAPHFEKSWDIPITVQEYQPEVPRKVMHKVIFLDKPFHRQQTTRDINTIFHKISLAARVLHPDHMSTYSFQPSPTLPRHSTNDKDETNKDKYANELDLMDVSLLETFATSTSKTNLGTKTEKPGKERTNSTETSSLENKTVESFVCEIKDTNKGLSEQSSSHSVEMNSNLKSDEHNNIIAPPKISTIEKLTGDNQPEEQSQTDMISVSSSEKTLEGISKSPNQNFNEELFEKNQNDCYRQPEKMCINEKLDSTNAYSVNKNPGSSNKESSFEEVNAATISNEGDFNSNKKQDKQPGGIERKNNKNKGNIDDSADEKELSTASGIQKVEPAEEDSDSSPELVIHFESSDTDEAQAEKDKISMKLPTINKPKIVNTQVPYTSGSPIPSLSASPSALIIDTPASPTPVAPILPTPIQISYTPRSPIADLSVSPSTLVIDAPTTPDSTSLQPGSPIADLSSSPSALIIDTASSATPDAPASPTLDTPASLVPDTPILPTPDSTSLQIPYTPGSPIADLSASPSALIIDTPASPTPATPASPLSDTKILPTLDTTASPIPDAPASPIPDTPASPTPDAPASPTPDAPASPTPDAPASPIPDAPGSPLSMQENLLEPFERAMVLIPTESNVNVFEFDDIKPKSPIISDPGSSIDVDNTNNLSKKRKHRTAFELGPLDSILEKQEELLKTTNRIKSASAGTKSTATISKTKSESTVKQPNNILPEIKFDENPEDYLKPESGKNITYCIWNFGDLRLLVRCKYSAVKKKKKSKEFIYLIPKLEYQVGFGHEQTTISEASQMWISSLIRHNCSINRIRINAFSSDVMMEETFSFHQIRQLYNPAPANNFMYNLFQKLQSLKPGSYCLSHTEGENASVISQVIPEKSHPLTFDLKKMYPENIPVHLPKVIPWVPLDPNLLTQFHEFYGRVPCTFHPPDVKKQTVKAKKKWKKKKNQNQ